MDHLLGVQGIAPAALHGQPAQAEDSHVAVAAAVASGLADAGPGIEAAAQQFGLGFVPLIEEDYFLVCLKEALDHPAVERLRLVLASPGWPQALSRLAGYTPLRCGEVLSLTQALPWWHFRRPKAVARG
jgi:putative molybdopterin biosynthesis protein